MKRNNPSLLVLGGVLTLAVLSACGKGKDATSEVNANCAPSTFSNAGSGGGTPAAAPAGSGGNLLLTATASTPSGSPATAPTKSPAELQAEKLLQQQREEEQNRRAEAVMDRYATGTPYDAEGAVQRQSTAQQAAASAAQPPCSGVPETYNPSRITSANQANQNSGIVSPPAKMERPDSAPAGTSGLPPTAPAAAPTTEGLEKVLSTVKAANPPTTSDPTPTTPTQAGQDCTGLVGGKIGQNCTTRTGNTGFAGENLGLTDQK